MKGFTFSSEGALATKALTSNTCKQGGKEGWN